MKTAVNQLESDHSDDCLDVSSYMEMSGKDNASLRNPRLTSMRAAVNQLEPEVMWVEMLPTSRVLPAIRRPYISPSFPCTLHSCVPARPSNTQPLRILLSILLSYTLRVQLNTLHDLFRSEAILISD